MPTSEISRKVIEPQPILYIRREVVPTQLQALFTECFPVIFGHAMQHGAAIAGNPMARYITVGQGSWTVDSIVPLLEPAEGSGEIEAGFLHGGPVATATHSGTYETLAETYSAIEKWVKEQGYTALGGNWEWYVTDPGEHPNPADWKTEVFWPLAE
jgi:AraC family transcriptional regulator